MPSKTGESATTRNNKKEFISDALYYYDFICVTDHSLSRTVFADEHLWDCKFLNSSSFFFHPKNIKSKINHLISGRVNYILNEHSIVSIDF